MNYGLTINEWKGSAKSTLSGRQIQLLRKMLNGLIHTLGAYGLPSEGQYWATPDAESEIGVANRFRIQKRSGNTNQPGVVFLRVWLDVGCCFAVGLRLSGNNKLDKLFESAMRKRFGNQHHVQFTPSGEIECGTNTPSKPAQPATASAQPASKPARSEPVSTKGSPTSLAQQSTCTPTPVQVQVPVAPTPTPGAIPNAGVLTTGDTEVDEESAVGLSRFFADHANRVLILAQLAELCCADNAKEIKFPDWLSAINREWSSAHQITSVGVRRAIAKQGRALGWLARRIDHGTTWYSLTWSGVNALSAEATYRTLADKYRQIAGFTASDPAPAVAATDPLARLAAQHAEFVAAGHELTGLRKELTESEKTLGGLRATVSRLEEELRSAKGKLREAEADATTPAEVAEAERKLAELQPVEELYQRVNAMLAR